MSNRGILISASSLIFLSIIFFGALPAAQTADTGPATAAPPSKPAEVGEKEAVKLVTYAGVVTGADGKPVAGAVVRSDLRTLKPSGYTRGEAETRTDAAGHFTLGPLPLPVRGTFQRWLVFEHPDHAIGWMIDSGNGKLDPEKLQVKLARPAEVSGLITDDKGLPVADATVEAFLRLADTPTFSLSLEEKGAATTDANGHFAFAHVPEGALLGLKVSHKQFVVWPNGSVDTWQVLDARVGAGTKDFRLKLQPAGRIVGRLLLDGKPLERANVAVAAQQKEGYFSPHRWSFYASTLTDKDGRYELNNLPPGTFRVSCRFVSPPGKEAFANVVPEVAVVAGPEPKSLDLSLERTALYEVNGRVTDAKTGLPIAGAYAYVTSEALPPEEAVTDAEGRYVLHAPATELTIGASPPRNANLLYDYSYRKVIIKTDAAANHIDMVLVPKEVVAVRGQLLDENGKGVAGVVTLPLNGIETAPDGSFEVGLPAEKSQRRWWCAEAVSLDKRLGATFEINPDQANEVRKVVLQPTVTIKGRVVYEDGEPTPRAKLQLNQRTTDDNWGVNRSCNLNADGTFVVEGIALGLPMSLLAEARGMLGQIALKDPGPGQIVDVGDIKLKGIVRGITRNTVWDAVISGRVVDENKKPLAGARVELPYGPMQAVAVTDTEGRFRLDRLPALDGPLSVYVHHEGYVSKAPDIKAGTLDVEIQLFPPPAWEMLGKPAPELIVGKWFNSEPLELKNLRGKVVLLYLGLRADRPDFSLDRDATLFADLQKKYADKGLVVIGVHRDLAYNLKTPMTEDRVAAFLKERQITVPFAIDRPGPTPPAEGKTVRKFAGATCAAYQLQSTPTMVLIDRSGVVRYSPTFTNVNEWVEKLLAEPATAAKGYSGRLSRRSRC